MSDLNTSQCLRLYLMRHGEVEAAAGKIFGQTDVPLSERGLDQSRRLAGRLSSARLTAVYSSDMRRATVAANMIAGRHGLRMEMRSDWREINLGEWEGRSIVELYEETPERIGMLFGDPASFKYPGGESFADFMARIQSALHSLLARHPSGEIALVAHGGVCRAIIASVLETPAHKWLRIAQDYGCLNVIDWYAGGAAVALLNSVPEPEAVSNASIKTSETPQASLVEGEDYYQEGTFVVFTARYHLRRGYCCRSGCRHCPYGEA